MEFRVLDQGLRNLHGVESFRELFGVTAGVGGIWCYRLPDSGFKADPGHILLKAQDRLRMMTPLGLSLGCRGWDLGFRVQGS